MVRSCVLFASIIAYAFSTFMPMPARAEGPWDGHAFAFCFVTDDGRKSNLAFADTARVMDFRFTIGVNVNSSPAGTMELTLSEMHELWEDGFELAQHGGSHASIGLDPACPQPPSGSLMGYFMCEGTDEQSRMEYLAQEISADTLSTWTCIPRQDVRVVAYPRHRHGKALIDTLRAAGYIGARTGNRWGYSSDSYGDFTTMARNSWDGGMSLYRMPTVETDAYLFGDHSADPPVHLDYDTFRARADQSIAPFKQSGGICIVYTHHLGDDDDSLGDINYGSGGMTKRDLAWLVDYVREHDGKVMTFGEAVSYYRARSHMENIDGDLVWVPGAASAAPVPQVELAVEPAHPNPFNGGTRMSFEIGAETRVRAAVFDLRGRRVAALADEVMPAGRHEVSWTGRDDRGRSLAAGSYVVQVVAGDAEQSRLVSLLK